MTKLKFSGANAKLRQLNNVEELKPFLENKRKVYSFDSGRSGYTCPFAKECLSKAVVGEDGKRTIKDGPDTLFRCFSASQEVLFTNTYNARKHNEDILKSKNSIQELVDVLLFSLPNNAGIIRIDVAGDIFNQMYFDALMATAQARPEVLWYAYTKSLPYWVARLGLIPENLILTASYGGRCDDLIAKHNLRSATVLAKVEQIEQAKREGWPIDHDDSHAARPSLKNEDFYLLVHSIQPKGSDAGKALKHLKGEGSYTR